MLRDFTGAEKVYICCGYTDLRQGIDGLSALVRLEFDLDPFSNTLFLFCGRRRDRIKVLYWEGNGFVLLYKRLESGSFQWPRNESEARSLTPQQYRHTDGYAVYHGLPEGITVVGCHAHLRRKFDDAIKSLPKGKVKGSSAYQGLAYCDLLFAIEKGLDEKNATTEERYKERLEQAKPVLDAMFAWANSRTAAPKSALGKAFHYLKEQWPYLTNYLKDGRLEISNNRAERSIKPFVIDRKNFLFANTPEGASGSAVMFSMIQTAIENGLDPYKYLTWLLREAKDADLTDAEVVQRLLPWNMPEERK